jgi:NAD(P)-dependent dehydrogenase (short-subunit alcohol dehydrogenase family)
VARRQLPSTRMAVVLITGCSSGFGREAAKGFAERGHDVVATMRDPARALGPDGRAAGLDRIDGIVVESLDVVDADSRRRAVDRTLERFGRIDVLVNNAGISALGPTEEIPDDIFRGQFETNFFGPWELIKLVLPPMRQHHTGRIVNITSIGAQMTSGFYGAYCATKHALDGLSAGLDIELQQWGIRCVTVVPGGFTTSMADNRVREAMRPDSIYAQGARAIAAYEERIQGKPDLSPVVDTIVAAAFDDDPKLRYLVGTGTAELLAPVVAEREKVHAVQRARDAV